MSAEGKKDDKAPAERCLLKVEELLQEDLSVTFGLKSVLFTGQSKFQDMAVVIAKPFGKTLLLDGKMQSSALDEKNYHESLIHPAMLACSFPPKRVFIGGGGEGASAREVMKHKSVEKVVMVDIDETVVDVCKKHLPEWGQDAWEDPRLELVYDDAKAFLENWKGEKFDVIIMDLCDPLEEGPANLLYTKEFYDFVARERLSPGGVFVTQSGGAGLLYDYECFTVINRTLASSFKNVWPYLIEVPSYGTLWGFNIASNDARGPPRFDEIDSLLSERIRTKLSEDREEVPDVTMYDGISHQRMFTLPKYLRVAIAKEDRIMTVDHQVLMY